MQRTESREVKGVPERCALSHGVSVPVVERDATTVRELVAGRLRFRKSAVAKGGALRGAIWVAEEITSIRLAAEGGGGKRHTHEEKLDAHQAQHAMESRETPGKRYFH
jgi:hypothetical protein